MFLHGSKESNAGKWADLGRKEDTKAAEKFMYALYEVELEVDVKKDGSVDILKVNGTPLVNPVKG